jgi:transposase
MTEPLHKVYIGVDVASAKLDLATNQPSIRSAWPAQIPNQPTAITRWLRTLPPEVHLVCESTGPYHLALLRACWQLGVTVSRVNPEQVRAFARSRRLFAKTDRLDAQLLADFAAALTPPPTHAPDTVRAQLRELHTRRAQLVAMRADELKRQEQPGLGKVATASLRRTSAGLTREITKLEVTADQLVDQSQELHHFRAVLMSPQGVGALTATAPPSRNSAKSPVNASPVWPDSPPSSIKAASLKGKPTSTAGGWPCAKPSTWPPSPPCAATPSSNPLPSA